MALPPAGYDKIITLTNRPILSQGEVTNVRQPTDFYILMIVLYIYSHYIIFSSIDLYRNNIVCFVVFTVSLYQGINYCLTIWSYHSNQSMSILLKRKKELFIP